MKCQCCGILTRGGSEARRAAGLCLPCWHRTPEGAIERSRDRANQSVKPGKLWQLTPGTRVEKVTIDFGFERPFQDYGTIVGEPVRDARFAWKIPVKWDKGSQPVLVDSRRLKVATHHGQAETRPVH